MKYKIDYCTENHPKLTSYLFAIGLDKPSSPYFIDDSEEFIEFSGWILTHKESDIIRIVTINKREEKTKLPRNKIRSDVTEKFSLNTNNENNSKLGFYYKINIEEAFELGIEVNGETIIIWKLSENQRQKLDIENKAISAWLALHKSSSELNNSNIASLENIETKDFEKNFETLSPHNYLKNEDLGEMQNKRFLDLVSSLQDPKWPIYATDESNRTGSLKINGISQSKPLNCRFSIAVHYVNFIFFENEAESVYLVQYCRNVLLILPEKFIAISFFGDSDWSQIPLKKTSILLNYLVKYKENIIKGKEKGHGGFLGFNLSQPRPYHFFYDYLYGLFKITNFFPNDGFDIYSIKSCDFFNSSILEGVNNQFHFSDQELNDLTIKNSKYLLSPAIEATRNNFDGFTTYTENLLKRTAKKNTLNIKKDTFKSTKLTIWLGISSEKRSWFEQEEGFRNIVNNLSKIFQSLKILVDGRTFPLHPHDNDITQKKEEEEILSRLALSNKNIEVVSIIGMQAIEKINLARSIDFFISNYGTDSMYPSAICRKPGVVYAAPSIGGQKSLHKHDKIIEVPASRIKEIHDTDGVKAWHEASVSMDWRDVYACILELIDTYGIRK